MSLLLEALRKAELAKQQQQGGTAAGAPAPAPSPEPAVITREKLPDISQPLEILTDDLPSAGQRRPAESAPEEPAPAAAPPREAARQLFEAKAIDYNPRRPFYFTLAALAVAGVGYGVYLWWQLRPPAPTVNAAALRPAARSAPVVASTAAEPAPVAASANPSPTAEIASEPESGPKAKSTASAAQPAAGNSQLGSASAASAEPSAPAYTPTFVRSRAPRAQIPAAPHPSSGAQAAAAASAAVDPQLERAYQAFEKGDLRTAHDLYEQVLSRDPISREALFGLAAIDVKTGNYATAAMRYERLLDLDPRDARAQAALIALREPDPLASESRIKNLLAAEPTASDLYFALGNQYARQSRWPEAQAAYAKAYASDPSNPDYAFNLAVALDHLRQSRAALDYYRRALALAATRPIGFARGEAEARIAELSR